MSTTVTAGRTSTGSGDSSTRVSRTAVIVYMSIAFTIGYQVHATWSDLISNMGMNGPANEIRVPKQEQHLLHKSLRYESQLIDPTKAARPIFSKTNPTQCELLWDWPFLDTWVQNENPAVKGQITTEFHSSRSNSHPTAEGTIQMQIIQLNRSAKESSKPLRRVMIYITHPDAMWPNSWHRIAVQYEVWIAWQVAEHRLSNELWSSITHVEVAMKCTHLTDIPQGWNDLIFAIGNNNDSDSDGSVIRTNTTLWCTNEWSPNSAEEAVRGLQPFIEERYGNGSSIDAILIPPQDGLMWDLAWDTTFQCTESHMFRTFMSQFAHGLVTKPCVRMGNTELVEQNFTTTLPSISSTVCWIVRYGNAQRDVYNRDDVHGMLLSIFDTVRILDITKHHTSAQISNIIYDCQVLYGVHGAGMVNAMLGATFSWNKTAVVEVLPNNNPQYFRSVSALVGHYYQGIATGNDMSHSQYIIDVEVSAEALRRALRYVMATLT